MAKMSLASFDPVRIALPDGRITEAAVDARVQEIASRIPGYERDDAHEVRMHDKVKARVTLRENGAPLAGLDNADLTITVGDGFLPQAFAEGMAGMRMGECRSFSFEVPAVGSSGDDGLMSVMDADIEMLEIKKRIAAELSDEWVAAHIPHAETVEQMRDIVRKQLEEESERKRADLKRARCLAALAQRLAGGPDPEAVERATAGVRANFERQVASQGKTRERQLASMGMTEEQLEESFAQEGMRIATEGAALELVAEHFGIEVSEEEIDRAVERTFSQDDAARLRFEETGDREKMRVVALCEKALGEVERSAIVVRETTDLYDPFS